MIITPNTKISALLKAHPEALDVIVGITPKFEKLRNPLLRKLMAGRTSIAMAAKVGGCDISSFYEKLKPLGFEVDEEELAEEEKPHVVPAFLHQVKPEDIITLDVRPIIDEGRDPLKEIMKSAKATPANGALKIINTFEPTPLISVLEKQGYKYFVDEVENDHVETWFYKEGGGEGGIEAIDTESAQEGFEDIKQQYAGNLVEIDVRHLQMPMPMHTILATLETLPEGKALYVNHKRIPVFLLPELKDQGFDYRIKEIADGDVKLLIFK